MTAQDLFREGRLSDAVEAQNAEVRSHPADPERRYLLFALLAFTGDLDRAARQLDAIGIGDERLQGAAAIYRNLLLSEAERRRAFSGQSRPVAPPDAPAWLTHRIDALTATDEAVVTEKLEAAAQSETSAAGAFDGQAFTSVVDTDELLGPTLEIFAGGRYVLLPFASLKKLRIPEPTHVLDLLWTPAHLEDAGGTAADVHLPVLYPGSTEVREDRIRLGRTTEWYEAGSVVRGRGQKVLSFGGGNGGTDDVALLSIRELEIGGPAAGES